MSDEAGFGDRRGRGRGGRGRREGDADGERRGRGGRGRGGRGRGRGRGGDKDEWTPTTKLGRLVKSGAIRTLEEIFLYALPVKEYQIIDALFPKGVLKDEAVKIMPVQKQTNAGQRTRFKAVVVVGDRDGHIGLGTKVAREVAGAIRGAIIQAKLGVVPVRRGFWGTKFGDPHTVPVKVTGKCGTVLVRLVPAPRGTGLVAATTLKKFLEYAGVQDCYTKTGGKTRTMSNFLGAAYQALINTHAFLTPDLWKHTDLKPSPFQLADKTTKGHVAK